MTTFGKYENVCFIGIGGIGMSALARYFHASGKKVIGYDRTPTKLTSALTSEGIEVFYSDGINKQTAAFAKENTLIVYTPAIKKLALLEYFKEAGFTVLKRAKVLGLITEGSDCIAIAGTHGKTTTSSLVAHLCREAGLPFSCFLGGIAENFKSNFYFNGEEISVVEADEYDRSFLNLSPNRAVITSTDADHLDIYGDRDSIEQGFSDFAALVPDSGNLFVRKGIQIARPAKTYAVNEVADFYADNLRMVDGKIFFDLHTESGSIRDFVWEIPGIHNVENAVAAIAILRSLNVDFETIKRGISSFQGIKRRYTKHTLGSGKIYIDDYAHHPTELDAVIGSVRAFYPGKKLFVVFQPHLFSRTRDFAEGFAKSLANADELLLLDIYPARELQENFPGITSSWLSEKIKLESKKVSPLSEALEKIKDKDFDILLTVGAGDIDTLYEPLLKMLAIENEE